jgi:hypothetical protein
METKTRRTRIPKASLVLGCLISAIGVASAFGQETRGDREEDSRCKHVTAMLAAVVPVTDNCPSPVGMCFAGITIGSQLLRGTFFASALAAAPSAGLAGIEPPTTVSYAGDRTIITSRGVLTLRFVGVFDTARNEVAELNRVSGGTGRFEGATGRLWVTAFGTLPTIETPGEAQLTGQICTNR